MGVLSVKRGLRNQATCCRAFKPWRGERAHLQRVQSAHFDFAHAVLQLCTPILRILKENHKLQWHQKQQAALRNVHTHTQQPMMSLVCPVKFSLSALSHGCDVSAGSQHARRQGAARTARGWHTEWGHTEARRNA